MAHSYDLDCALCPRHADLQGKPPVGIGRMLWFVSETPPESLKARNLRHHVCSTLDKRGRLIIRTPKRTIVLRLTHKPIPIALLSHRRSSSPKP